MQVQVAETFDDYVASGDETTKHLLHENGDIVLAIRQYYTFLSSEIWEGPAKVRPLPTMLAMNSFMLLLSAIRISMTGHASAVFPLLRTSLESACYAFIMSEDESLESTWLQRHQDEAKRSECRRRFTPAVKYTVARLNEMQSGGGDIIGEAYDCAIDSGAHPNPMGLLRNIRREQERGDGLQRISLVGLHSENDDETIRSLFACLEYAGVVGIVLIRMLPEPSQLAVDRLHELAGAKDAIAERIRSRK